MHIKKLPTQDRLCELLEYTEATGVLTWKKQVAIRSKAGSQAGTYSPARGYVTVSVDKKIYLAHRLVWMIAYGIDPAEHQIDHANGIRNDNRLANLRLATRENNMRNSKKPATNKAGFKGVYWDRRRNDFGACIREHGKNKRLGNFPTPELAHEAYVAAAKNIYGDFARFN